MTYCTAHTQVTRWLGKAVEMAWTLHQWHIEFHLRPIRACTPCPAAIQKFYAVWIAWLANGTGPAPAYSPHALSDMDSSEELRPAGPGALDPELQQCAACRGVKYCRYVRAGPGHNASICSLPSRVFWTRSMPSLLHAWQLHRGLGICIALALAPRATSEWLSGSLGGTAQT